MGLDQRIIEVTNEKKVKKLLNVDLWTKYVDTSNKVDLGIDNILKECGFNLDFETNWYIGGLGKSDTKKMKKDGFVVTRQYRKFNELQGWFERNTKLENTKGVRLTERNIDKLLCDIKDNKLVKTEGYLYGDEEMTEEKRVDLIDTLNDVKSNIVNKGKTYLYTSWY